MTARALVPLLIGLAVTCCPALHPGAPQHTAPFVPPLAHLIQDRGLVQESVGPERRVVLARPHLVHDLSRPRVHDMSRSRSTMDTSNSSQPGAMAAFVIQDIAGSRSSAGERQDVVEDMERMVHLHPPQEARGLQGPPGSPPPGTELHAGPQAAESSLEASGFYSPDAEDRERMGEEGEEDEWERSKVEEKKVGERERREGDDETLGEVRLWEDLEEVNHTRPNLDSLIGYSPSFLQSSISDPRPPGVSSLGQRHHAGLEGQPTALSSKVVPSEREVSQVEEEGPASGYGSFRSSVTMTTASSSSTPRGGVTAEVATRTDFGAAGSATQDTLRAREDDTMRPHPDALTQNPTVPEVGVAPSRAPLQPNLQGAEEPQATGHAPHTVGFTGLSRDWLGQTTPSYGAGSEVVCVEWSDLVARGYVVLNMTHNMSCEQFCAHGGVRLLDVLERVFARIMSSPEGSWAMYISKPTHQQHQLLVNVASKHGVMDTKDVLGMLGEIRQSLDEVGVQSFSGAGGCPTRPGAARSSDYGKLLVVLLIIGSVCSVIITSGLVYICWQRRPPAKTMSRAEELHFVENGCHDNPTLDVTGDGLPVEMREEKKPSANGSAGRDEGGGADSHRWQVFVNQPGSEEEEEEQDTHL